MDNNWHSPDLVQVFVLYRKRIKPDFKTNLTPHMYDSRIKLHYINNDL